MIPNIILIIALVAATYWEFGDIQGQKTNEWKPGHSLPAHNGKLGKVYCRK